MKNRKLIATLLTILMLLICSATAFAEDVAITETEPSTITEVADISTTDNTTQNEEGSITNEDDEGVTVIREEVTLENTEPAGTDIVISTNDVSLTEGKPENDIVVNYADAYTDIPATGSNKVVAMEAFVAICGAVTGLFFATNKYKKQTIWK